MMFTKAGRTLPDISTVSSTGFPRHPPLRRFGCSTRCAAEACASKHDVGKVADGAGAAYLRPSTFAHQELSGPDNVSNGPSHMGFHRM